MQPSEARGAISISDKDETFRKAKATARIHLPEDVCTRFFEGRLPKGEGIETARVAGVMAAKNTPSIIPFCHPIRLTGLSVAIRRDGPTAIVVDSTAEARDRTGVEMEALTAVSVTALTIIDMTKALTQTYRIEGVQLLEKTGGKSGDYFAEESS